MDTLPFDPSTITREDLMIVGIGISGIVVHIRGTNIVVKKFGLSDQDQHSEQKIYEHLQSHGRAHPNILKYYGRVPLEYELFKGGLLFEFHAHGPLKDCLGKLDALGITPAQRSCWPYQAVSAVAYIHSLGVTHCDLGVHNFLIHNDGRLVLCDFAGSGMEGIKGTVAAGTRYTHPDAYDIYYETGPRDDIFALGSTLYELYFEKRLFEGQTSDCIRQNLREGEYPELSAVALPLRNVIKNCWFHREYTASMALTELGPQTTSLN
ncbi:hypothetical protein PRK78_005789 [Emydomyces testavorans]|uniref:Protein kinase domain-containing protein n=1 Tax=Emydomyces testavorans TaxID=2070801 RepID=A0AAF0DL79_9EURO|nr:hypothetical protein PRK78_005789 [Emydomyces testavorans]